MFVKLGADKKNAYIHPKTEKKVGVNKKNKCKRPKVRKIVGVKNKIKYKRPNARKIVGANNKIQGNTPKQKNNEKITTQIKETSVNTNFRISHRLSFEIKL